MMTQFPATEAKVAYDHLTFRSTIEALRAESGLDSNELWARVRDEETMGRVAQAMLRTAASELCRTRLLPQEVPSAASDGLRLLAEKTT
jgi:hypothetical protein